MALVGPESYRTLTPRLIAQRFLVTMARRDKATAARLTAQYQRIIGRLEHDYRAATRALERDREDGAPPEVIAARLRSGMRVAALIDRFTETLSLWSAIADGDLEGIYLEATAWTVKDAMANLAGVTHIPGAPTIPQEAIAAIISNTDPPMTMAERVAALGYDPDTLEGQDVARTLRAAADAYGDRQPFPVRSVLNEFGEQVASRAADTLIHGVATGRNPRVVAEELTRLGMQPLHRALTIARTEMLRAYREGSASIYREHQDVLAGWMWWTTLDSRTCASCLAQHRDVHGVEDGLDSHPNCRCAMVPIPDGMDLGDLGPTGEEWFRGQSDRVKRKVLGRSGAAAYNRGDVRLADFVRRVDNPVWGAGTTQAPLRVALDNARRAGRGTPPRSSITSKSRFRYKRDLKGWQNPQAYGVSPNPLAEDALANQVEDTVRAMDHLLAVPDGWQDIDWGPLHSRQAWGTTGISPMWRDNGRGGMVQVPSFSGTIGISPDPRMSWTERRLTTMHEFGHYLDLQASERNGLLTMSWMEGSNPVVQDFMRSAADTRLIQRLADDGSQFAAYAVQSHEVWARAFSEWMIEQTDGPGVRRSATAGVFNETHWDGDEWERLAPKVRAVLVEMGVLR